MTLINTFTLKSGRQEDLIKILDAATSEVMSKLPGFISANIHASADGKYVANYAQWNSIEEFKAMLKDTHAQEHMAKCTELADASPIKYEVSSVFER